jgi:EAL domain-containing protein (putative c-di-GMP-specific phosphodiesterase class I)
MLLPQTKEREYRFKLALRMGLPIFALLLALIIHTFIDNSQTLQTSFYLESLLVLVFSIYFIFYLIYSGFEVKITDNVSKTFTREYLYKYLNKELKQSKEYTLILVSVDNLNDINTQYGIKNGDRVLESTAEWIASYLKTQKIENFPLGHIKGGDFILGLDGLKHNYNTILDLMCLKSNELKVDDIEITIHASVSDTSYSKDLDYIIENLFELQEEKKTEKKSSKSESINPNKLELSVIEALKMRRMSIMTQSVFRGKTLAFKECFVKLKSEEGKLLFTKSYIKIINKLGLGVEYDLMVLEALVLNTSKEDENIYALNISPTSLRNEKFLSKCKELLKTTRIKVMFVLSEAEYFSHVSRYQNILNSLRREGVLIAIDRLGSIHTSFLYLRELNIDVVRFDTYYSSKPKIEQNRAILEGFIKMCREKKIQSWIKNIEDHESLALAQTLNIDYIQGKALSNLEMFYEK